MKKYLITVCCFIIFATISVGCSNSKIGKQGHFVGEISFVVDSALGGFLSRKAYDQVKFGAVVEEEFEDSFKVIIKSSSIVDPNDVTVGHIRYLSEAESRAQNKIGESVVIDKEDFSFEYFQYTNVV